MRLGFWDTGMLLVAVMNFGVAILGLGTDDFWPSAILVFAMACMLDGS